MEIERSPPTKRKSTNVNVKEEEQENASPKKVNDTVKKEESPKKSPIKKTPAKETPAKKTTTKKNTPKSNGKAKTKKASPIKNDVKVKTEATSPSKVKKEKEEKEEKEVKDEKMDSDEKSTETRSPNVKKEEKPKINPFFTKQKDMKLQSIESTSDGTSYDPGKSNYHPIKDCFWKHGEKYVVKTFKMHFLLNRNHRTLF